MKKQWGQLNKILKPIRNTKNCRKGSEVRENKFLTYSGKPVVAPVLHAELHALVSPLAFSS